MSDNENETGALLKVLAPFLAATVVVSLIAGVLLLRFVPAAATGGRVDIVSFDIIKFTNSQRAVASTFIKPNADIGQANELLLKLPERARAVIKEIAGAGTLVVIKQAVVQGQTRDITDEVLGKLGLPTNVPTADATAYSLDVAPTMLPRPEVRKDAPVPFKSTTQTLP